MHEPGGIFDDLAPALIDEGHAVATFHYPNDQAIPKRPGEPDCTFADIGKIQRLLGWQPVVSFETGVAAMLQVIDAWRAAPVWTAEGIAAATREWFQYLG